MVDESTSGSAESPAPKPQTPAPATAAQISLLMAEMGRKGGKLGGKRRMQTMTARQRKALAKKAATARWAARTSDPDGEH